MVVLYAVIWMAGLSCYFTIFTMLWPSRSATSVIYSLQFIVFNILSGGFILPETFYHCLNHPVTEPALFKKVCITVQ